MHDGRTAAAFDFAPWKLKQSEDIFPTVLPLSSPAVRHYSVLIAIKNVNFKGSKQIKKKHTGRSFQVWCWWIEEAWQTCRFYDGTIYPIMWLYSAVPSETVK